MREAHLVQRLPEMLEQMKAVGDLGRLWGALPGALGIRTRPIARDDLHTRMLAPPLRHRRSRAVGQQGDGLAAFQIDEDRAIDVAFPQRPIIHPQDSGRGEVRLWLPAEEAQQGVAADGEIPGVAEAHAGFSA